MGGDACLRQSLDRGQPFFGAWGPWFEDAVKCGVKHRYGYRNCYQSLRRHWSQKVQITQNAIRFGRNGQWMVSLGEHFETLSHDAPFTLDRLIGVCVGAKGDGRGDMALFADFRAQQICRIGLCEQPTFEVEPGRQVMIGMCWTGIAIDTAMFAAAIRIDRLVKRDVWGSVACQDRLGPLDRHQSAKGRVFPIECFAIIEPIAVCFPRFKIEAGRSAIGGRSSPAYKIRIAAFRHPCRVSVQIEQIKNIIARASVALILQSCTACGGYRVDERGFSPNRHEQRRLIQAMRKYRFRVPALRRLCSELLRFR